MDHTPVLFDSHCHLDFPDFDPDLEAVLSQCEQSGIGAICIPGTEALYWPRILNLVQENSSSVQLFPALGLHPYFLASSVKSVGHFRFR